VSRFKKRTVVVDDQAVEVNLYPDGHLQILVSEDDGSMCRGCYQYLWAGTLGLFDRLTNPRRWFRTQEQQMWVLIRRCAKTHKTKCLVPPNATATGKAWESL